MVIFLVSKMAGKSLTQRAFNKVIFRWKDMVSDHLIISDLPGLVNVYITNWKNTMLLMGKSTINGPFSMAMLNNQRVYGMAPCFSTNGGYKCLISPGENQTIHGLQFILKYTKHASTTIGKPLSYHMFICSFLWKLGTAQENSIVVDPY